MSNFKPTESDEVQFIEPADLSDWLEQNLNLNQNQNKDQNQKPLVINVSGDNEHLKTYRFPEAFTQSINIADFLSEINELDPDQPVVVICQLGQKSFNAAHRLIELDFSCVYSLHGGLEAWKRYLTS